MLCASVAFLNLLFQVIDLTLAPPVASFTLDCAAPTFDLGCDCSKQIRERAVIVDAVSLVGIALFKVAEVLEYSASNEENLVSLAEMYAVSVEDVKRALTEPLPQRTRQDSAITRFGSVVQGNDTDTTA